MKKIPILFLSILISGLLLAPIKPTSAIMEARGTTWWTVEELLDFYQEVEQEKEEECGDNQDCKMEFNFSMYEKGPKYSALDSFMQGQFWITSVNPAEETIKVLFFDEDIMLKQMGIEEKLELEHLYIAWFENWKAQVYNGDYEHFYDDYMEGLHKMYAGISSIDGPNWIPAWQEVELSVAGSHIVENTQGIITFSVFAEHNMFNAQGSTNYLSCLREPDYSYGTECKMYVSGDQGMSFFPPREQIEEQNEETNVEIAAVAPETEPTNPGLNFEIAQEAEPTLEQSEGEMPELLQLEQSEEETLELSQSEQATLVSETKPTILSVPDVVTLKAPETGQGTASDDIDEAPLVLLAFCLLGVLIAMWWFTPTETQKIRKKFAKKSKKPLTKKTKCDKMVSV